MSGNEFGTLQREGDEVGVRASLEEASVKHGMLYEMLVSCQGRQALDLASRCTILAPTLQALAPWAGHSNAVGFSFLLLAAMKTQ